MLHPTAAGRLALPAAVRQSLCVGSSLRCRASPLLVVMVPSGVCRYQWPRGALMVAWVDMTRASTPRARMFSQLLAQSA